MKKRTYKLLKRSFLIFLALVTFLLVLTPMPVLPSDVLVVGNISNDTNKILDEDFHLFCLAALSDRGYAIEAETTQKYQDYNYEISLQSS
jgi:hypothetical protein